MQCGVITVRDAMAAGLPRGEIRRRLANGSWQQPVRGVLVTDPGPLSPLRRAWCAVLAVGPDAVLAGSAAAAVDGLTGYEHDPPTVLIPAGRQVDHRRRVPGVVIRRTARLAQADLHPVHLPRRTAPARSAIDMAEWAPGRDEARAALRAAVAQGVTTVAEVRAALTRRGPISRRTLIVETLDDLERVTPRSLALLYQHIEDAFGLPRGRPLLPDRPDAPLGRLDVWYGPWRLLVRLDATGGGAAGGRAVSGGPAGGGPVGGAARMVPRARLPADDAVASTPSAAAGRLLPVPADLLWAAPGRLAALVADALAEQGWRQAAGRRPVGPRPVDPRPANSRPANARSVDSRPVHPPESQQSAAPSPRRAALPGRSRPRAPFLRPVPDPAR